LNKLFDKVDENQVIQLEKELISLESLYMARVKELQLKLGECGKEFPKKEEQLTELTLMNPKTLYDVLCSTFQANWTSRKEHGKDYTFDSFSSILITALEKMLNEGKISNKL
jgi:hypothetical protein